MQIKGEYHIPALLKETIDLLEVRPGKRFIDATLGGGGHSKEILLRGGELLSIDRDPEAVKNMEDFLKACPSPAKGGGKSRPPRLVQANFSDIDKVAQENGFTEVDGILFDLGVSSHQLETPARGFSFNLEGPLDMRMDPNLSVTAKDLVNGLNEGELAELFSKLGEEKFSKRYSRAIVKARQVKPIETCNELAEIILRNSPPKGKFDRTHPATRVFQALRIAVNDELNAAKEAFPKALGLLKKGGRLAVLSFHSLEDGIVKRFFLENEQKGIIKVITEKPVTPTPEEVKQNPRARSAKLRVAEKIINS
jgi:16S rRNA (cytosine1402-N4)-methyltransferase